MKSMSSSRTRRRTARAWAGSSGGPQIPRPVMRMAPKPRRVTSMSPPMANEPDAEAVIDMTASVSTPVSEAEPLEVQQTAQGAGGARIVPEAERAVAALALVVDEHPHERVR